MMEVKADDNLIDLIQSEVVNGVLYTSTSMSQAAAIDAAPRGTEASVTALMFTGAAIFGAISPVVAGRLRELHGMDGVFVRAGMQEQLKLEKVVQYF